MPLQELSSESALKNLRTRSAIWPQRGKGNRKGILPLPEIRRKFEFQPDDLFFCLGSCFAQHVGAVLNGHGFHVATHQPNPHVSGDWGGANHLIRYNVYSMLNEFRWALDPSAPFSHENYAQDENGTVMDPYGHTHWKTHTLEEQKQLRDFSLSVTKSLAQCRVVIVTLGLAEVWFDRKAQLYTNTQPSKYAMRAEPDRYVFRVLAYEDILAALEDMHGLLSKFGHPDFRMLVTASPVPLHATYRDQDVFVANTYSKSVQRAALEVFQAKHENVYYFPSYECITLGHPDFVWKDDQRHVTELAVGSVMEHVIRNFAPSKSLNPECTGRLAVMDEQWAKFGGAAAIPNQVAMVAEINRLRSAQVPPSQL